MDQSDQELERLSALLHALPIENMPMTLSELDGYVVGVLACPDMIPPSEWMSHVWGETGEANFPDQKTAEATVGAVMAHYNSVAEAMTRSPTSGVVATIDRHSALMARASLEVSVLTLPVRTPALRCSAGEMTMTLVPKFSNSPRTRALAL